MDLEEEIDCEYWNRIKPAPFHEYENYSSRDYNDDMSRAFNKFMLAYCLGTDNVEMRKFLTHRYYHSEYGDELYGKHTLGRQYINYAMFDYLHNGLAYVVDKYAPIIKENYKNLKK